MQSGSRQHVAIKDDIVAIKTDFDDFVHQFLTLQFLKDERKQFALKLRQNLRQDDNQACMQILPGIELSEVAGIVGHERKIIGDDPWHQIPIGLAAQAKPVHMRAIVAIVLCDRHERCVEAFVDQELHDNEPDCFATSSLLRETRLDDLIVRPCSVSLRGRPLAGWAAAQISESSIIRSVREG